MNFACEEVKEVLQKCDISFEGDIISRECLLKIYTEYFVDIIENKEKRISFSLHTGSICFDVMTIVCSVISNIAYNESDANSIIDSLFIGDKVLLYNTSTENPRAQRCIYAGKFEDIDGKHPSNNGDYIILNQDNGGKTILPSKQWSRVVPYLGAANTLDGRGIRRTNPARRDFFKIVLEMDEKDIPRIVDVSTIFVMPKERAFRLINGISFIFGSHELGLTELVPIAYYTDGNQELFFGNNPAKIEPVIKIASKISVGRKLLLQKDWNRNIGFVLLGDDLIRQSESELPEILYRKEIQYICICSHIDSENMQRLVTEYEDASVFACTKDMLLSNTTPGTTIKNKHTTDLQWQIDTIIDQELVEYTIDSFIEFDKYKLFKKSLFAMKSSDFHSDEKDNFIIQAHSLMKIFITSTFSIKKLDQIIQSGEIDNVKPVKKRLTELKLQVENMPQELKENALAVIDVLDECHNELLLKSKKETALMELLQKNSQKSIAIVVPKAYYETVLKGLQVFYTNLDIYTNNRFNNNKIYDAVIAVGNSSGKRFDILRCKTASTIYVLLYEFEKYRFNKLKNEANTVEALYNKRSAIPIEFDEFENKIETIEDMNQIEEIDDSLDQLSNISLIKTARLYQPSEESHHTLSEVVAVARFTDGEAAFFTKNYKAYILDDGANTALEVKTKELAEGDNIIFTSRSTETRDIVDEIFSIMIEKGSFSDEIKRQYEFSKLWKETLTSYMNETGKTAHSIAELMIKNGISVQEATIRGWLDEDSHTIGPQKQESIQQIALIANNDYLFDHSSECFQACASVRKVRRRILTAIGNAVLGGLTGDIDKSDIIYKTVKAQMQQISKVLQIESITFINEVVPISIINRPIHFE